METAAFFARKHGLERYLDDPAELNSAIFKLLVLQEALQEEQARRSGGGTGAAAISVRRTVHGKFTASCSGDDGHAAVPAGPLREHAAQHGGSRGAHRGLQRQRGAFGRYPLHRSGLGRRQRARHV
jgi:hypothetical protein